MYEVTLVPVLLAGLANMIIGFIWYHPKVLGHAWMKMAGITQQQVDAGAKMMPVMALLGLFFAIVMAYVMAHFAIAWGVWDWIGAVELAFWLWLGFVLPPMMGIVLWEGKSVKLLVLNASYWLLGMIVMALILVSRA